MATVTTHAILAQAESECCSPDGVEGHSFALKEREWFRGKHFRCFDLARPVPALARYESV